MSGDLIAAGAPPPLASPPVPKELLDVPAEGRAGRSASPKRVIVIGAGLAGLVAAYELARRGHTPVVLEAQNRVGGRVHTLRTFSAGLYAEAGAMRIPRVHELSLAYCRHFGLELRPFVMDSTRTFVYVAGQRMTVEEVATEPERLGFDLEPHERGRSYEELWNVATSEIREMYARDGERAFDHIGSTYGHLSIRDFLRSRGFSEGAVELYGVMSFREANMNDSVVEQLREILGRAFEDMQEIVGGMDLLPRAFYRAVSPHVRLGAQVHAVQQHGSSVTVHWRNAAGAFSETGDYAICTVPCGVLRHIDFSPALSRSKYRAIRELNYNPSTKILLQVRRRFWESDHGIVGGTTTTDLPVRRLVYPSHPDPHDERGILLASYTWGQDAARWGSLGEHERISLALNDVAKIHPQILDEFEGGASYAWYNDPYAGGAFALFKPGQEGMLHGNITSPEGRVHFAGEHCSKWHAWIQGALESGLSAALAVNPLPAGDSGTGNTRQGGEPATV